MPVQKSKGGYKYGRSGKTYRGKGAKAKAAKQGRAIQANKKEEMTVERGDIIVDSNGSKWRVIVALTNGISRVRVGSLAEEVIFGKTDESNSKASSTTNRTSDPRD